jgi:hypothetical protein
MNHVALAVLALLAALIVGHQIASWWIAFCEQILKRWGGAGSWLGEETIDQFNDRIRAEQAEIAALQRRLSR